MSIEEWIITLRVALIEEQTPDIIKMDMREALNHLVAAKKILESDIL